MAMERQAELLTVAEAAKLLKVSTVTVQRWLKQGRLPAYRVGPRAVRIRHADLTALLVPTRGEAVSTGQDRIRTGLTLPALTAEQVQQRQAAIAAATRLRQEMLARRGGRPLTPSWPVIRQAREERSKQL